MPAGNSPWEKPCARPGRTASEVLLRQFQARRLKGKEYDFALTYDEIWYDARTGLVRTAVSRTTDTGKMTPIEALLALAGAD